MISAAASYLDTLLAEFVNREDEVAAFTRLLDDVNRRLMVIWGEGGVGKTSLQAKLKHEIAQRKLRKAEIVWTDHFAYDYLAIMRKLRDDCGVDYFKAFTDLANYFTVPQYNLNVNVQGGGSILQNAQMQGSQTGDIAGVVIRDLMLVAPRGDMDIPEPERLTRLTSTFVPGLAAATEKEVLVVFLDAAEKMSDKTKGWIWEAFLTHSRDGALPNVKFIICGRADPQLDRSWRQTCEVHQLRPLKLEHIEAYLQKRGVKADREIAKMLLAASKGNLLALANIVDAYLNDSTS